MRLVYIWNLFTKLIEISDYATYFYIFYIFGFYFIKLT